MAAKPDEDVQQRLRSLISGTKCVLDIQASVETLKSDWRTMGKNQIDAHNAIVNASFRLLNKVLPDLRSTEITSAPQHPIKFVFQLDSDKKPTEAADADDADS